MQFQQTLATPTYHHLWYELYQTLINRYYQLLVVHTINDKSLVWLKFGESTQKSVWQHKVWQILSKILGSVNLENRQIRQTLATPNFGTYKTGNFDIKFSDSSHFDETRLKAINY